MIDQRQHRLFNKPDLILKPWFRVKVFSKHQLLCNTPMHYKSHQWNNNSTGRVCDFFWFFKKSPIGFQIFFENICFRKFMYPPFCRWNNSRHCYKVRPQCGSHEILLISSANNPSHHYQFSEQISSVKTEIRLHRMWFFFDGLSRESKFFHQDENRFK